MAVEVVFNVADEWLAELAADTEAGQVERRLARVTIRRHTRTDDPLVNVSVQAGYVTGGVAVRLEQWIGVVPRGAGDDTVAATSVGARANEAADAVRLGAEVVGVEVRAGRLVTVG